MKRPITAVLSAAVLLGVALAVPSASTADPAVTHHEFQANCTITHTASDDPIVHPGHTGMSHNHTFMGNRTTNAYSTTESLMAGTTSCRVPKDKSAYWVPTLTNGTTPILSTWHQTLYYKSGILDYAAVQPFPLGIRFVVGNMTATKDEFRTAPGAVEGWECGESFHNWDFPAWCPAGTQLNIRYQAPSCWDGVHLDSADHKSHMAYPVNGACTASHPVPVPMLEYKIAFPTDGNMAAVQLASGRGYSWHYDFFNAWDPATQAALVDHCINGGLQCDARGFDLYKPGRGAALNENYELP
ncbi:DUF1996 domain-containing protein [Phytomonospora endophytica]|uniref:DUF1996 domain-containing protein n=1 Tax=Phytomonospora endophytica TaxID=714109 RepID=A0A841FP91_9ACTN|nr:DUF1996 domain-containing protein [Phytomonospora endophytica]MBB6035057.1 hypothetical protein [Phytomonospora endophytica]GIG68311.1 hypothetical protein Pen01_46060 [Phytomonospora endophytica]